jgi:hypothetical protein
LFALSLFAGVTPAHEHKAFTSDQTDISTPISPIIKIADISSIPG